MFAAPAENSRPSAPRHPSEGWDLPVRATRIAARDPSLRWGDGVFKWVAAPRSGGALASTQ